MIRYIKITNNVNEELIINMFNYESSGFTIRSITGLGPVKADITTTKMVVSDGDIYNSARANSRNIVLTLGFEIVTKIGLNSIEDCRQRTYKYFPLKKKIKFTINTDNRELYIYGYVESNEPDIFSNDETAPISIICPDPWFRSEEDNSIKISNVKGLFKFPFEVLESDLIAKDLTDTSKEYGLPTILEKDDTHTNIKLYGNDVFNFYDNKSHYGDFEFTNYRELSLITYKDITIFKNSQKIV